MENSEYSLFPIHERDTWEDHRVSSLRDSTTVELFDAEERTVRVGPSSTVHLDTFTSEYAGAIASKRNEMSSYLMHCGGLVWSMDWSPHDEELRSTWLAVGCHPKQQHVHEIGRACHGKALIQIWRLSNDSVNDTSIMPEAQMAIVHEGGVTWSLSWCPAATCSKGVGLLAAVLGDGRICVWDVPKVEHNGSVYDVEPLGEVPAGHVAVDGSLPCTVDWLPHAPHDLLLVGYQDGCVSIVKLFDSGTQGLGMQVIQYFPSDVLPLSAALWFPHIGCAQEGGIERHAFVTGGAESIMNIWDSRNEYYPRVSVKTGTSFAIQDMCWTHHPLGVMMALEDGTVRGFLMEPETMKNQLKSGRPISLISWRGNLPGAMWTIDASQPSVLTQGENETIAYAGEDGIVGIMHDSKYVYASKKRQETPHLPLVGLWCEGKNTFSMQHTRDLMEWKPFGGLSSGKSGDRKEAMKQTKGEISDVAQTVCALKFSKCPSSACGQWLAYGNVAGLVHCIWVPSSTT